jgi:hypothetical protein
MPDLHRSFGFRTAGNVATARIDLVAFLQEGPERELSSEQAINWRVR